MRIIKKYYPGLFILLCFFFFSCINLEQTVTLNEDGSGTMQIHYWTHNSNITAEEIYGFGFTDYTVNKNYTSENSQPSDIVIEKNDADSTTHVRLNLKFRDINRLPEAQSFSKITAEWDLDEKDGLMVLDYRLLKDSINAMSGGMSNYSIVHEFKLPGKIVETNGFLNGDNTVRWTNTLADLVRDVDLVAKVKPRNVEPQQEKKCGLFGVELPIIFLLTLLVLKYKSRRR